MDRLILGTAGHIDHGKTALVRALTGVDTDRLPEEKRRGITIDLGFASLDIGNVHFAIVDVPGHEAFIRNMLAGATGVDVALLVIAADEGVMPQTREHLAILGLLDVPALVVALTKTDIVEDSWLELVHDDVRATLAATKFADAPILPVSALRETGLDALRASLLAAAAGQGTRAVDTPCFLPVDRVFTVRGTGTVVTGTLWSGTITRDSRLALLPDGGAARVRGIQVHGAPADQASAGERAAVALAGTPRTEIRRGDVLADPSVFVPTLMLTVLASCLPDAARPIGARQRVRLHIGTAEVLARVVLLEPGREAIDPGAHAWAQLRLEAPVVTSAGTRFVLRSYSPVATIGGGVVAEPVAPKRSRIAADEVQRLKDLLSGDPNAAAAAAVSLAGWSGVPRSVLPARLPRFQGSEMPATVLEAGSTLYARSHAGELADRMVASLETFHAGHPLDVGIPRDQLRQLAPPPATPLADRVLADLEGKGALRNERGLVALAGHNPTPSSEQAAVLIALLDRISAAGLEAPTAPELGPPFSDRSDLESLLHFAARVGKIVQLPGSRFAAPGALRAAAEAVRQQLPAGQDLAPGDFREVLGISRKHLLPLLEYFDLTGVTARIGESRRLAKAADGGSARPQVPSPK